MQSLPSDYVHKLPCIEPRVQWRAPFAVAKSLLSHSTQAEHNLQYWYIYCIWCQLEVFFDTPWDGWNKSVWLTGKNVSCRSKKKWDTSGAPRWSSCLFCPRTKKIFRVFEDRERFFCYKDCFGGACCTCTCFDLPLVFVVFVETPRWRLASSLASLNRRAIM